MMTIPDKLKKQAVAEVCGLLSEGYRYIGRLNDNDRELIYMQHANGNRIKVVLTFLSVYIIKNGHQVKRITQ